MVTTSTIRVAPALAIMAVARDFGLDPTEVLTEAGWSPRLLNDPDNIVPFVALGRLTAIAAARTGCAHFGLLVGQKARPSVLGALGFIARSAPDVRTALQLLIRHFAHHGRGALVTLVENGEVATLGYRIQDPTVPGAAHITTASLAIGFQMMKMLCGSHWRPLQTSFALHQPADAKPYQSQFGKRICFDAAESAFSFSANWLDCKVASADPELQRVLLRAIGAINTEISKKRDLRDEVRSVLTGMIGHLDVNLSAVANTFGLSNRTLHRRLATLGTSFQELHDEVRYDMACRLLENTTLPVAQVALALGYSEVSVFTRSFKRRFACGPATWRVSRGDSASDAE